MIHNQTIETINKLREQVTRFDFVGVDIGMQALWQLASYLLAHSAGDMQTIRRMHSETSTQSEGFMMSPFLQSMYSRFKGMHLSYTQRLGSFDSRRVTMVGLESLVHQLVQFGTNTFGYEGVEDLFADAFLQKLLESGDTLALETLYRLGAHEQDIPQEIVRAYKQRAGFAMAMDEMENDQSYLSTLSLDNQRRVLEYVVGNELKVDANQKVSKNLYAQLKPN